MLNTTMQQLHIYQLFTYWKGIFSRFYGIFENLFTFCNLVIDS